MRHVQSLSVWAALLALSAATGYAQSGTRGGFLGSGSRGYAPAYSGGRYAQPTYGGYYGGAVCGGHFGGYAPAACGGAYYSGCGGHSQVMDAPAGGCGYARGTPTSGAYGGAPAGAGPNPTYAPSGVTPHTSEYPTQPPEPAQPLPPIYHAPPVPLPGEPTAMRSRLDSVDASQLRKVTFAEPRMTEPLPTLTRPRLSAF